MNKSEVLCQFIRVLFLVFYKTAADVVADEGIAFVIIPRRNFRHPIPDMLGGICQQLNCLHVFRH